MTREENSKIIAELYASYTGTEPKHTRVFTAKGTKEHLLGFVKWLWKYHRKDYYRLAFANKRHNFRNAIFEDWGNRGYLPYFGDEPDYYYIYC